jgi:hypothetical protein
MLRELGVQEVHGLAHVTSASVPGLAQATKDHFGKANLDPHTISQTPVTDTGRGILRSGVDNICFELIHMSLNFKMLRCE